MTTRREVCLVIPAGTYEPAALIEAVRVRHSDAGLTAVWGGDLQRRPPLGPGTRWIDLDLPEPTGVGWGRLLTTVPSRVYEWARTSRAVAARLRGGGPSTLVLRLGSSGVVGALDEWWPATGVATLERAHGPLPLDGLAPSAADLASRGRWSTAVLGVAHDADSTLDDIGDVMSAARPSDDVGPLLELALSRAAVPIIAPRSGIAVGWRGSTDAVGVVDVDDLDRSAPWCVRFGDRRPRQLLSQDARLAAAVASSLAQHDGVPHAIALPGGIEVDVAIRTVVGDAVAAWRRGDGALPPDPYDPGGLIDWLQTPTSRTGGSIGRYWFEEWVRRPDLHVVFPDPMGEDRSRFLRWAEGSWRSDGRSPLLRAASNGVIERWTDADRAPGVDVIGYVASDSGLGDFTRRLYRSLDAAGVPVGAMHYHRTASPTADDLPPLTTESRHDVNLITVHADQMRFFADDHGETVFPGRTNIGFWFWELSELTPRLVANIDFVDEVWAATEFIADAYRRVTDKPVRVVPLPVPEPARSTASRAELGLPDDRFVFLATLDHLSITDRKNPIAAIRAFEQAFPVPGEAGPVLVVKTLNASQRWSEHEELQLAAASRPDVTVIDRHVSRADQMRLIELSDCLVSLHRSEGLGLHLMEAMWLGTPVIATRYSGNLDFMTDENSVLVDAELIQVVDRQGYYPPSAVWADPHLDEAAAAMRRIVDDDVHRRQVADAARRDMMNQPSMTHTGHLIARLCREAASTSEE